MQKVLGKIARHFQFVEATVYLHNPSTDVPGRFSEVAAIWPWSVPSLHFYVQGQGGTGWVLQTGHPLRLLDMALYSEDREYYEDNYPGMDWPDRVDIKQEVRRHFQLPANEIFPLSYVCVPILHDGTVTGALRCAIARSGPYHVDDDIVNVVSTTADMIADWWDQWTRQQQQRDERQSALSIMSSLGAANRRAVELLQQPAGLEKIIVRLLDLCRKSVPQADIVELWLQDPTGILVRTEAGFAGVSYRKTASVEEPAGSVKHNAFRYSLVTPSVLHVERAYVSPFVPPGRPVLSFTVAPVITKDARGVLYFAATQEVSWPGAISSAASALADQLALYLSFQRQILGLKDVQDKLQKSAHEQAQFFLDFQHQLRTPIYIARNSLDQLGRFISASPECTRVFNALSSSTRRAGTVANNLQFFVSLAQGKPVAAIIERLSAELMLGEIEQAYNFLYSKGALNKRLEFAIRKEYPFPLPTFEGDPKLIELAIDNILDNAVKYSFHESEVLIEAGSALYGREVFFSFRNRGLPITPDDAPRLAERGFRGTKARLVSPEGTGIGLWAVAEMMRPMSGRLEVKPTNAEGLNEFRLCFRGSLW